MEISGKFDKTNPKKRDETHFDKLLQCCKKYTVHIQTKFEDSELEMEVDFPEKRISKKMKMPGEHAQDESRSVTTTQKFKALYFNILDCAMTVSYTHLDVYKRQV